MKTALASIKNAAAWTSLHTAGLVNRAFQSGPQAAALNRSALPRGRHPAGFDTELRDLFRDRIG
ncbi:hypothetical protein QF001_002557 [Paraburkholderia youngii]